MTLHRIIQATDAAPPAKALIGEIGVTPIAPGAWSPRRRIAVIAAASAWLWVGLATIGHYTLG